MGQLGWLVAYSCPQWFLIDVPENKEMQDFLGDKYGTVWAEPYPKGMLGNVKNMTAQCSFYYEN